MNKIIEETIEHLSFLARHFSEQDVQSVTVVFLLELNVPSNYDGFSYLERAVPLYFEDPTQDIVCIYETIANQTGWDVEPVHIENAIRSALKAAWAYRDVDVWEHYCLDLRRRSRRPTNAEFISMLAQILKLWKGCCKAQRKEEVILK